MHSNDHHGKRASDQRATAVTTVKTQPVNLKTNVAIPSIPSNLSHQQWWKHIQKGLHVSYTMQQKQQEEETDEKSTVSQTGQYHLDKKSMIWDASKNSSSGNSGIPAWLWKIFSHSLQNLGNSSNYLNHAHQPTSAIECSDQYPPSIWSQFKNKEIIILFGAIWFGDEWINEKYFQIIWIHKLGKFSSPTHPTNQLSGGNFKALHILQYSHLQEVFNPRHTEFVTLIFNLHAKKIEYFRRSIWFLVPQTWREERLPEKISMTTIAVAWRKHESRMQECNSD